MDMKSELVMWEDIGLLDYIGDVENIYIPSYDEFEYRDSADIVMIPIDDETLAGFSEEEIQNVLSKETFLKNKSEESSGEVTCMQFITNVYGIYLPFKISSYTIF